MNEKFTQTMQEAFGRAASSAMALGQQVIDVEHLLYALLEDSSGIFYRVLSKLGIRVNDVRDYLNASINKKPNVGQVSENDLRMSYDLNQLIGNANTVMTQYKDSYMSVEHLILALFKTNTTFINDFIKRFNLNEKQVKKIIDEMRGGHNVDNPNPENNYEVLEKYGRNLIQDVRDGKLDPVIGRDEEIRRVIQILSRKTKNNPILIGNQVLVRQPLLKDWLGVFSRMMCLKH